MTRRIVLAMAAIACWISSMGLAQAIDSPKPSSAQTVYFSEHGKVYHAKTNCFALSRTTEVYQASLKDAETHGLKQCHICFRTRKSQPSAKDWSSPSPKKENER